MQKATLSTNAALQSKQRMIVEGIPTASAIITRDEITLEVEVVERPDGTQIPGGRVQPGEFNVTIDLADNDTRRAYYGWYTQSIDQGGKNSVEGQQVDFQNPRVGTIPGIGISRLVTGSYKRSVTIVYHRLQQLQGVENQPIVLSLLGCWVKSCSLPDYDMAGTESSQATFTICYDDGRLEEAA